MITNLLPVPQLYTLWHSSILSEPYSWRPLTGNEEVQENNIIVCPQSNANQLCVVLIIPWWAFNTSHFDSQSPILKLNSKSLAFKFIATVPQIVISIMTLHAILLNWLKPFNMKCIAFFSPSQSFCLSCFCSWRKNISSLNLWYQVLPFNKSKDTKRK